MTWEIGILADGGRYSLVQSDASSVTIGRRRDCEVALEDDDCFNAVSGNHARIERVGNGTKVTDLQSRNGTFVNGVRVDETAQVVSGDVVRLGEHGPLVGVGAPGPAPISRAADLAASSPRAFAFLDEGVALRNTPQTECFELDVPESQSRARQSRAGVTQGFTRMFAAASGASKTSRAAIMAAGILAIMLVVYIGYDIASSAPVTRYRDVVNKASPSVVKIVCSSASGGVSLGSGFVISTDDTAAGSRGRPSVPPLVVVTNFHVIDGAASSIVEFTNGEEAVVDGVIAFDRSRDIAILSAEKIPLGIQPLKLRHTRPEYDDVVIIGSPLFSKQSVTKGVVSQFRTHDEMRQVVDLELGDGTYDEMYPRPMSWIETDTRMIHGNSGGPVVSYDGEVIGVATMGMPRKGDGIRISFAVSSLTVVDIVSAAMTDDSPVLAMGAHGGQGDKYP